MRAGWVVCLATGLGCSELPELDPSQFACPDQGCAPGELGVQPIRLDFGDVALGALADETLTISNSGELALQVCLQRSGGCATASEIAPTPSPYIARFEGLDAEGHWAVPAGESRALAIRLTPTAEGNAQHQLVLRHTGSNGDATIGLVGRGVAPELDFSTAFIDFGASTIGRRTTRTLTLSNRRAAPQAVSVTPLSQQAVLFGASVDGMDTATGATLSAIVPAEGALDIEVWFEAAGVATVTSALTVQYCSECFQTVALSGHGVKPTFEVVPTVLDFGTKAIGAMSTKRANVRNTGAVDVEVTRAVLAMGTSPEFSVIPAQALPAVLAPMDELVVDVRHTGVAPGRADGHVRIETTAWNDPGTSGDESVGLVEVVAVNNGPDVQVLPASIDFGTVSINGVSRRPLIIENGGNADLRVTAVELGMAGPELTLVTPPSVPITLMPAGSIEVVLQYAPVDAGVDTARVVITSSDQDEPTIVVNVRGEGGVPADCALTVAPSPVAFGFVERGRSATRSVEIRNSGGDRCSITRIALTGDPALSLLDGDHAIALEPGDPHFVVIAYGPSAYGSHAATLEIDSDDPTGAMRSVAVTGVSQDVDVTVTPPSIDFGVAPVTCRTPSHSVTINNTGIAAITLTAVGLSPSTGAEFELQAFGTPATLPAGGSVSPSLRYHPRDVGFDSGALVATLDIGGQVLDFVTPLLGEGRSNTTITDSFQQAASQKVDMLFVVDNSCSMQEEQSSLAAGLAGVLSLTAQHGVDFQIGVTTTDVDTAGEAGRLVPISSGAAADRIIDGDTVDPSAVFTRNVSLGTNGSVDEQGLEAAYLALSDPLLTGHNAGFLREAATLAVVIVSDEEDHSSRQLSFYEAFLTGLKPGGADVALSAIVGTRQPSCAGAGGRADYASRYIQVAQSTGGVAESICSGDWSSILANIALNSFGFNAQFSLSSAPVPATISVAVDGVDVPSVTAGGQTRWTYDSNANRVVFEGSSTPSAGASVEVSYTVACLP